MRLTHNQYEAILEFSPNMIWRANIKAECDYFNSAWLQFRGRHMEFEIGSGWIEGVHPDDKEYCLKTFIEAFNRRISFEMDYRLQRYDGEYRWINDRGKPFHSRRGSFLGYIGSCIDIDDKIEGRILRECVKNERIDVISRVAAGLAHEIRNPLTTVKGFLQIMNHKNFTPQYNEYIDLMLSEVDKANQMITDFLYLDCNRVLKLSPYNLNDILDQTISLIETHTNEKGIKLSIRKEILPPILINEKEVSILIFNLTLNGIEAMNSGTLSIRTYETSSVVVLQVTDEGRGIDKGFINKIGKPFESTKESKVGIGLAICYSIVKRHNAEMNFETCETGTRFSVAFKKSI